MACILPSSHGRPCRAEYPLADAGKRELVSRNVAALVDAPAVPHRDVAPWTREEAQRFLATAATHRLGALFTVGLALGLRKGEALGLRWEDVDLDGKRLTVRHQLQRIRGEGLVLRPPKTARSRRTLPLPEPVIAALKAHRVKQLQERLLSGGRWRETGHVFTTSIGTPIEPANVNKMFAALVAASGVPKRRVHDTRHWAATVWLAMGVPPRVVMDLLGHSQIATTMDLYGHVLDEDREAAAALMGQALDADVGTMATRLAASGADGAVGE